MSDRGTYFYRCYSHNSAGGLISGKGPGQARPLGDNLLPEFINHLNLNTRKPTALVSVSSSMIDTLRRAFNKFYKDREDPSQIWIAFIYVPYADEHACDHAKDLAKILRMKEFSWLLYEYVFEWEIPRKYLIHQVSVETLRRRGFDMNDCLYGRHLNGAALPSIPTLKKDFAKEIFISSDNAHEVAIQDGVDVVLDWWLTDPDFCVAYEEHLAEAEQIREDVETAEELYKTEMQIEEAAIELGL